jgi:NADH:ubiquinone oxidoreductase subunit 4 (subunit M)
MIMISHGLTALFLLVGMIYERRHTRLIETTADRP